MNYARRVKGELHHRSYYSTPPCTSQMSPQTLAVDLPIRSFVSLTSSVAPSSIVWAYQSLCAAVERYVETEQLSAQPPPATLTAYSGSDKRTTDSQRSDLLNDIAKSVLDASADFEKAFTEGGDLQDIFPTPSIAWSEEDCKEIDARLEECRSIRDTVLRVSIKHCASDRPSIKWARKLPVTILKYNEYLSAFHTFCQYLLVFYETSPG